MKTLLILLALVLNNFGSVYDEDLKYKTTGTDGISNINFITLSNKNGIDYEIWVCSSHVLADVYNINGIIITKDQLGGFVQRLTLARNKYLDWVDVINRNDIRDYYLNLPQPVDGEYYKKDMHLNTDSINCFYNNSQIKTTKIVKNQKIRFTFVVSNGFYLLINSDNLANTGEPFKLYFNSVSEIDNFIKVISNLKR